MENKYLESYKKQNLRACQLKQLDILDEIVRICEAHGIGYWLDGGTLLGAARHKGFIPWDDDIDVAMTQEGLDRFLEVAPGSLPEGLRLFNPYKENAKVPIAKVRDLNSLLVEFGDDFKSDYDKGIYVDIFPYVPSPSISARLMRFIGKGASKSFSILHAQHYYSVRSLAEFFYFGTQYLVCKCLWEVAKAFMPMDEYFSNTLILNGYGKRHLKSSIFPLATIEFEGKTYSAPGDSDAYLKDQYGDYMQMPPEDKRVAHAYYFNTELIKDSACQCRTNSPEV